MKKIILLKLWTTKSNEWLYINKFLNAIKTKNMVLGHKHINQLNVGTGEWNKIAKKTNFFGRISEKFDKATRLNDNRASHSLLTYFYQTNHSFIEYKSYKMSVCELYWGKEEGLTLEIMLKVLKFLSGHQKVVPDALVFIHKVQKVLLPSYPYCFQYSLTKDARILSNHGTLRLPLNKKKFNAKEFYV